MVSGLFYCVGEMVVLYSEDEEIRRLNFVLGLIYREFVSLAVYTYAIFVISFSPLTGSHYPEIFHRYRL